MNAMARTGRRVAMALVILVVLVAAVVAATQLWPTIVPTGLAHPHVDVNATFGAGKTAEAESFEAFIRVTTILSQLVLVSALGLYAWRGTRFMRDSAAGPIGTGFLLGMLGLGIVWLVQLPFTIAELWWLRRHDVIDVGYVEALVQGFLGLGGTFLTICAALLIAMGLARLVRGAWWIPAAAIFVALFTGLLFISPYLTSNTRDPTPWQQATAVKLMRVEGVNPATKVSVERVHSYTSQPNAYVTGLGSSQQVFLWDTLADRFPRGQVRVVLAHEIGHLAHRHLSKQIGWFALTILPIALLIALVVRRRGGMAMAAAVPLALFVFVVANLVLTPLNSAVSRRYEAEADWTALRATRDPEAMQRLFVNFTRTALADPDPPGWWHVIYDSHPSGRERVQMAREWAARNGVTIPGP
ncbi:MAG: peptidase [Solirubrobacterales bacterium]|nr:peptidase [Solirubrobacterales bacterium]